MKSKGTFKCGTIISAEYKIYKGCLKKRAMFFQKAIISTKSIRNGNSLGVLEKSAKILHNRQKAPNFSKIVEK